MVEFTPQCLYLLVIRSPQDNVLLVRLDHSIDIFDTVGKFALWLFPSHLPIFCQNMKLSPISTIHRAHLTQAAAWCTSSGTRGNYLILMIIIVVTFRFLLGGGVQHFQDGKAALH
jgi:hypothetical protein